MRLSVIILFLFSTLLVNCQNNTQTDTSSDVVSTGKTSVSEVLKVEKFLQKLAQTDAPQLIDVRTAREYELGIIENAIHIDVLKENFKEQVVANVKKDQPVFVYCKVGGRSARAADILVAMGYQEVYDLKGGYSAFQASKKE